VQTIAPWLEVIVVVSGSPESEWEISRRFESRFANLVMLKTGRREGLYTAWNRAIRISRGEFITNANTDDRLSPVALERLAAALLTDDKLGLAYADCIQTEIENETFPSTSSVRILDTQDYCFYDLLRYCYIGPCPMWRRSVHTMIGEFDESYHSAADYDFWLRLGEQYPITHLRETLGLYLDQPCSLAHQQIGKDESIAILRRRRENVSLSSAFPELFADSSEEHEAIACSAMADLCLEGPWPADLELALKFLECSAKHGAQQNEINRAVLLAAFGNQSEARRLLLKYLSDPRARHNLVWINSLTSNQGNISPIMIRTRHPLVDIAKQKQGLDPHEVKLNLLSSIDGGNPARIHAHERDESVSESAVRVRIEKSPDSILLMQHAYSLDPDGPNGGAETALIHLARTLAVKGSHVTIAAPLRGARGLRDGVVYDDIGSEYDYMAALLKHAPQHDVLIASNRGDVTAAAGSYSNLRKRLLWLHVNIPDATGLKPGDLNHCADKIICVSKFHKMRFEQTGVNPDILKVFYNGTDPRIFYARSVHRDHYRICYTGALVPLKGVHVLLEAFLRVKESIPQAVLDIYGSADMWGQPEYIDQSCWRGMGINFHGKVSQCRLAEAYSRSTMLVIPSRIELGETFGLGSIDAQACACPVLTTPCGGVVETVIDGVTGRILKQDSAAALAGGMIEMLMNPLRCRIMGEAGRTHVLQNFLWEQTADQFLSIINDRESTASRPNLPHLIAPVKLGGPPMTIHELQKMRSEHPRLKVRA
jgi:glycosyltransferase involved in cell wall biosynthesis